jgi:hypothetical protein
MSALKSFTKQTIERKRYMLRYDCWLDDGETLADFVVLISPSSETTPLIAESAFVDPSFTLLTTYLSGGVPGVIYTVRFVATTSLGQVKSDDIQMRVV